MSERKANISDQVLKRFLDLKEEFELFNVWFYEVPERRINEMNMKNQEIRIKTKYQCTQCFDVEKNNENLRPLGMRSEKKKEERTKICWGREARKEKREK